MLERLSIACSTSGGTDTFSTMKLVISRPYLAIDRRVDERQQRLAQLGVARGDVEHRNLRRRDRVGEDADDARAHRVGELVEPEVVVRAGDLAQERLRLDDLEVVGAERAHAHDAEVVVAQHHRVRRAPLVAGEEPRDDEVDVGLERRVEAERPRLDLREDRDVVGVSECLPGLNVSPNSPR